MWLRRGSSIGEETRSEGKVSAWGGLGSQEISEGSLECGRELNT